jgi:hypothetical protein
MIRSARIGVVAAVAFAATLAGASAASAAPAGDPGTVRTANPAQSCAAIPATLAQFGITPEGFDYRSCVREVAGRVPSVDFGSPYDACAGMEAAGEISYPYTFYAGGKAPFPQLRAHNREQCARALWTFHTIAGYLPMPV